MTGATDMTSTVQTAHTPITMDGNGVLLNVEGKQIAAVLPGQMREFGASIVHRVNCHDELVAALKAMDAAMCGGFDTQPARMAGRKALIAARAALAKATGSAS